MELKQSIDEYNRWFRVKTKPKSFRVDNMILKNFALFMHNRPIETISQEDILEWIELQKELDWKSNSIRTKCIKLKAFFTYWKKMGINVIDPYLIPTPQHEYVNVHVASQQEFFQLLDYFSQDIPRRNKARDIRNKAILWLLWDTGARIGEICQININDLNLETMMAIVETEKAKSYIKPRQVFWTEGCNEALKLWLKTREEMNLVRKHDKALFLTMATERTGDRMTELGVAQFLRTASMALGFAEVCNAHSFRHRKGHDIAHSGGSNSDIANILGHKTILSTLNYTQMSGQELERRYRLLTPDFKSDKIITVHHKSKKFQTKTTTVNRMKVKELIAKQE